MRKLTDKDLETLRDVRTLIHAGSDCPELLERIIELTQKVKEILLSETKKFRITPIDSNKATYEGQIKSILDQDEIGKVDKRYSPNDKIEGFEKELSGLITKYNVGIHEVDDYGADDQCVIGVEKCFTINGQKSYREILSTIEEIIKKNKNKNGI